MLVLGRFDRSNIQLVAQDVSRVKFELTINADQTLKGSDQGTLRDNHLWSGGLCDKSGLE